MKPLRFDGKVALVTGAGSGLGLQYAADLARRGAKVMINSIDRTGGTAPKADALAGYLRAEGCDVAANRGDVGLEAEATAMVEETVEAFGRIDILINNAGAGRQAKIQDTTTAAFSELLTVHLFGTFWTMRAALAHMRAQDYGRIVNTSSALAAFSSPGSAGYTTAKAAILALSKSASLDNEDRDIRVNAILPVALTGRSANFFAKNPDLESARMSTGQVSPVVMYLCHHSCALNGEALAAAAGRVARVFSATVPGYYSDKLTDEEVVANLETIMDTRQFHILRTSLEQHKLLPPLSGEAAGR